MRVLCCGSRDFADLHMIETELALVAEHSAPDPLLVVIEGGAKGADSIARGWAARCRARYSAQRTVHVQALTFSADWERYGKAAGPVRNQQMIDDGAPELVIAFVNKALEDSRGTWDMVQRAQAAGIPYRVLTSTRSRSGEVVDLP